MRFEITCPCGMTISANTFKFHVNGKRCGLSDAKKKQTVLDILDKKTQHGYAWLRSEGENASLNTNWFRSVFLNTSYTA
jgi:hypothetical protein